MDATYYRDLLRVSVTYLSHRKNARNTITLGGRQVRFLPLSFEYVTAGEFRGVSTRALG
jgi:hypothetical protein